MADRFSSYEITSCDDSRRDEVEEMASYIVLTCYLKAGTVIEQMQKFALENKVNFSITLEGDYTHEDTFPFEE